MTEDNPEMPDPRVLLEPTREDIIAQAQVYLDDEWDLISAAKADAGGDDNLTDADLVRALLRAGWLPPAEARRAVTEEFLLYVQTADGGAYNGSRDPGQEFYDRCVNPWLADLGERFIAQSRTDPDHRGQQR